MSAYKQQEFDFVLRTQKIIGQYNSLSIKNKYEVTLLLNCFVGLLILPQQAWYESLPDELISLQKWGISPNQIVFIKDSETKSIKNITRHLRNSISHYRFEVFSNVNKKISELKFNDYDLNEVKTFEATLSIKIISSFLKIFSTYILDKMKEEK